MMKQYQSKNDFRQGYAALTTTMLVIFASLTIIGGLAFFSLQEVAVNRDYAKSIAAHYVSESGIEDALWRVLAGKQIAASETLGVGAGTAAMTLTVNPDGSKTIRSQGQQGNVQQNLETRIVAVGDAVSFSYGVQVDAGGVTMGNGARVNGNLFSNGSVTGGTVTGNATVAAGSGNKIANATISGTARAPAFTNVTAGGSSCPNPSCVVASDAPQPLPISDALVTSWRDKAVAGGVMNGNHTVSGSEGLGPVKISGNLKINTGAVLTVTGTIWVTGTLETNNNAVIKIDPYYGANSGIIVADGVITFSNNTVVSGSGTAGSYLIVVGAKNAPASPVMDISNSSSGAIYYAPHGRIHLNNNAGARQISGYGFDIDNNATVTYESGLQNVHFSSSPSAAHDVPYWKDVE